MNAPTSSPGFAVVHVPHASTVVPGDVRPTLLLDDRELAAEILRMTDHFVDELAPAGVDAVTIRHEVSRLVVDPERFRDDAREAMANVGMGAVYERTSDGRPLRDALAPAAREALMQRFYDPHHARLSAAVATALDAHGLCLVIDLHSFPARPLPYELDRRLPRPEICLGTAGRHTPTRLRDLALAHLRRENFEVELDRPFAGSLVPAEHYQPDASRPSAPVLSLMIEVRRDLYMDEATGRRRPDFPLLADRLRSAVTRLIGDVAREAETLVAGFTPVSGRR